MNQADRVKIVVAEPFAAAVRQRLADDAGRVELLVSAPDGSSEADLSRADGLFRAGFEGAGFERVLEAATGLRWLHTMSAGVDGFELEPLRERGIVFTNSAGAHGVPIAEWVMYALLAIVKRGPQQQRAKDEHRWDTTERNEELTGKTLTIVGAGGIGGQIARRAAAFDMRLWGVNRSGSTVTHFERIESDAWRELLPETDFLVIATPLTPATHKLVGEQELNMLGRHAWLINVARGAVVDEPALIAALQDRQIGGAALDTFEQEPLPGDSPFWSLPNVLLSPHHSGSSSRTEGRVVELFVDNLRRFVRGEELRNQVDYGAEY